MSKESKKPNIQYSPSKWMGNLDFLKGLKGHINKEIEKKYCCKPSKLLNQNIKEDE